jgi:hypothetical protein
MLPGICFIVNEMASGFLKECKINNILGVYKSFDVLKTFLTN